MGLVVAGDGVGRQSKAKLTCVRLDRRDVRLERNVNERGKVETESARFRTKTRGWANRYVCRVRGSSLEHSRNSKKRDGTYPQKCIAIHVRCGGSGCDGGVTGFRDGPLAQLDGGSTEGVDSDEFVEHGHAVVEEIARGPRAIHETRSEDTSVAGLAEVERALAHAQKLNDLGRHLLTFLEAGEHH